MSIWISCGLVQTDPHTPSDGAQWASIIVRRGIEKEIALIYSENLAPGNKKGQFAEIAVRPEIAPDPLQFPTSVDLVVKNFDKLNDVMLPAQ
jgi:hypothetical protein